jgi:hypothetical protein
MTAAVLNEVDLLKQGTDQLRELLGKGWCLRELRRSEVPPGKMRADAVLRLSRSGASSPAVDVIIEAKKNLTPALVDSIGPQLEQTRRVLGGDAAVLVIAPWLSPRTRTALEQSRLNYLDLTGNVSIRFEEPTVLVRTDGAQRSPEPMEHRSQRGLSGAQAGRLVRELVDFREPRRAREVALAAKLSESYVSRLLGSLEEEGLIRRRNHLITKIDWVGLLRERARSVNLLKDNVAVPAVMRRGREHTLAVLRQDGVRGQVLATGSLAAQGFAPTTVGGAMMFYVDPDPHTIDDVCVDLDLLRTSQVRSGQPNADVLLLYPPNRTPMVRPHPKRVDGIPIVGLSQLVIDCLSGPGRLPAEGEAVLEWMSTSTDSWRRPSPLKEEEGAALS